MLIYEQLHGLSKYGELTTLRMGSVTWVLLNSDRVISEIIAKRGNVTSERPYLPIASGLVSRDRRTVLRQTAHWTEGRIMMQYLLTGRVQHLNPMGMARGRERATPRLISL